METLISLDGLSFSLYDPKEGTLEIVCGILKGLSEPITYKMTMPDDARKELDGAVRTLDSIPRYRLVNRVGEDSKVGLITRKIGYPDASAIFLRLGLEKELLGILGISNSQGTPFSIEDAELLNQLNEPFAIALTNHINYRKVLNLMELVENRNQYLENKLKRYSHTDIIGLDLGLKAVMNMVRQVAMLDSPVLLLGETGTGKELIANAIHEMSARSTGPFIKVNCGAIPETLIDSELFGHEKGAFTGAVSRKQGRFERAHGGTIFLDEIGELPPGGQVRLLRVLQEKIIESVGGTEPMPVNIRVIAATHRNLEQMILENQFRNDLYFRLKVFPISIPSLRERKMDIPALVNYFISIKSQEIGLMEIPYLSKGALQRLQDYHWPGNIRELENTVEREIILNRSGPLLFIDLPLSQKHNRVLLPNESADKNLKLDHVVSNHIHHVMQLAGGQVNGNRGAARLLDMNPSTLRKKMRKLGIPFGVKVKNRYS